MGPPPPAGAASRRSAWEARHRRGGREVGGPGGGPGGFRDGPGPRPRGARCVEEPRLRLQSRSRSLIVWAHSALRGPGPLRARGGTPDVASGAWAVWSVVSGGLHVHRYLDVASNVTQGADRGRSPAWPALPPVASQPGLGAPRTRSLPRLSHVTPRQWGRPVEAGSASRGSRAPHARFLGTVGSQPHRTRRLARGLLLGLGCGPPIPRCHWRRHPWVLLSLV